MAFPFFILISIFQKKNFLVRKFNFFWGGNVLSPEVVYRFPSLQSIKCYIYENNSVYMSNIKLHKNIINRFGKFIIWKIHYFKNFHTQDLVALFT